MEHTHKTSVYAREVVKLSHKWGSHEAKPDKQTKQKKNRYSLLLENEQGILFYFTTEFIIYQFHIKQPEKK